MTNAIFGENFVLGLRILSATDNMLEVIIFYFLESQKSVFRGITC